MSYEKETKEIIDRGESIPESIDISIAKYFWQASPLSSSKKNYIPKFLKKIRILHKFTDLEIMTFSKYMHKRVFSDHEVIFKEHDLGMGFYFVYSGNVDIYIERFVKEDNNEVSKQNLVTTLDRKDYFGELALLQDKCSRSATAIARSSCELIGFFTPDLEALMKEHPVVATKLLQALSMILSGRLSAMTTEMTRLKDRVKHLEEMKKSSDNERKNDI